MSYESVEGLCQFAFMGKEYKRGKVQSGAMHQGHWLKDREILGGCSLVRGKFQSSVNQALWDISLSVFVLHEILHFITFCSILVDTHSHFPLFSKIFH